MNPEALLIGVLGVLQGIGAYWIKRTDSRVDAVEKNYVRRDDYHRDQDSFRDWLERIEQKLDRLIERDGGSK